MKRRLLDEASFRAPSCHFRHIAFHSLSLCTLRSLLAGLFWPHWRINPVKQGPYSLLSPWVFSEAVGMRTR